jgi:hypothetical protein
MKRIVLVLAVLAAMAVMACKGDTKPVENDSADPGATRPGDTTPTDQPTTPGQGDVPAPTQPTAGTESTSSEPEAAGVPASTGIAECDTYIKRLLACEAYPRQGKDTLRASIDVWKQASEAGGDAARAAADSCKKSMQQSDQGLKAMGC